VARTQDQRKAETRQRLLLAAARLFASEGVDGASVDAIADEADRTSGSVYAHFGGKQGLLLALAEDLQNQLAVVMQAEFAAREDLDGRLRGLWRNISEHRGTEDTPWFLLEVELWLRAFRDPQITEPVAARYRSIHALMRGEFRNWVEEFRLTPPIDVDLLPQALMGAQMGLQMQHRIDPEAVNDDLATNVLLALFGARPAETRD
jgi:AcrR family transcriptional regulator